MKRLFVIIGILFSGLIHAQNENPITWEYTVNYLPNCEAELIFKARVEKGWHLYSQLHNGFPTSFEFTELSFIDFIGKVTEPTPHKEFDEVFQYDVYYFKESEITFTQKIKVRSFRSEKLTGKIYGQVCQYETGICMPLGIDFSFDLNKCP